MVEDNFSPDHSSSTTSTDADVSLDDAPHTSFDLESNKLTMPYHHHWRSLQSHQGNVGEEMAVEVWMQEERED